MINYICTDKPIEKAAEATINAIRPYLNNEKKVLLLLSGGSSIKIAINIRKSLKGNELKYLTVSLTDERYGYVGHKNENWQQSINAGFSMEGLNTYRLLTGYGMIETAKSFEKWLTEQLNNSDYRIGIFGIGTDGHTAGIKSDSVAAKSPNLIEVYESDDFKRITITFETIRRLDNAIIQASGDDKKLIIKQVMNTNVSYVNQPAQILKFIPFATLYTNIEEDS